MTQEQIHQLLHAYRSGHGQIAASVRLLDRDSDLVTRLSDLSGSLSSGIKFESYLTVYRLPSQNFFALARTWPDPDAPRAGCVVTHKVLVPVEIWSTLHDVRLINSLFRNPRSAPGYDFSEPVGLPLDKSTQLSMGTKPDLLASQAFVSRYLGRGLRPIVWFDAAEPEEYLWRLLGHLWPKLRGAFSCCTFSLQERTLEDRPFDLLFAPASVYSRFAKLSGDHLIEVQSERPLPVEPWCEYWAKALFSSESGLPSKESELPIWNELDEDPTAVRKLSMVQELRLRASQSPTAGVGAIDVVESLAPEAESALLLKRNVLADAITAATEAHSSEEGLTSLRLIQDRLRRESFRDVAADFERRLISATATVTEKEPETALQVNGTWLGDSLSGSKDAFVVGVMEGLRGLAKTDPSRLTVLRSHPEVAAELFRVEPTFAATYLQFGGQSARTVLVDWLSSTRDMEALRIVRRSVFPSLGTNDGDLLSPLLRDLRADEVEETLNALLSTFSNSVSNKAIRSVVADRISSVYPVPVRHWASNLAEWPSGVAEIAASTYGLNRPGFTSLLGEETLRSAHRAQVLAVMVCDQLSSSCPYWFRELASEDPRLIKLFLAEVATTPKSVEGALSSLLTAVPDVPVASSGELAIVPKLEGRPVFAQVVDAAMRSLIVSVIGEGNDIAQMRAFETIPAVGHWYQTVPGSQLTSLVVRGCSSGPNAVARASAWLSETPTTLYRRRPSVLLDLCDTLLSYVRRSFPQGVEVSLAKLLRRSQREATSEVRQTLSGKMLRFALDNVRLPLGVLVAESFADVYAVAVQKSRPPSFFVALFTSYDWDKAKDLRVSVVDAFLRSNWSPEYLAIAAHNAGILRKVFKRLHRKANGDEYARAMLQDLIKRDDPSTLGLREQLRALIADPDFYEEWD